MKTLITIILVELPAVVFPFLFLAYLYRKKSKLLKFKNIFSQNAVIKEHYGNFKVGTNEFCIKELFLSINFSKKEYYFPLCALFVTISICSISIMFLIGGIDLKSSYKPFLIKNEMAFAFIGAFVWGVHDIVERIRILDLTPYSLNAVWIRILISGVIGRIIYDFGFESTYISYMCAFAIGAFPISSLKYFIKKFANQWLKMGLSINEDNSNFKYINGINPVTKRRLIEENINCPENLAYADPVLLHLRTNIEWKFIIDLIDQSLLKIYVGDEIVHFRKYGVRGAIEATNLFEDFNDEENGAPTKTIEELAGVLKIDKKCMIYLLKTVHDDLFIKFIRSLWQTTVSHKIQDHTVYI